MATRHVDSAPPYLSSWVGCTYEEAANLMLAALGLDGEGSR